MIVSCGHISSLRRQADRGESNYRCVGRGKDSIFHRVSEERIVSGVETIGD